MSLSWFRKPSGAPEEASALAGEERLLAWAATEDGQLLVATPVGLWWPPLRCCG